MPRRGDSRVAETAMILHCGDFFFLKSDRGKSKLHYMPMVGRSLAVDGCLRLSAGVSLSIYKHRYGRKAEKTMNIYIGNLPYSISEDELRDAFAQFGQVDRANIIIDKFTGRSKGFGFIEMPDAAEAETAIESMNDTDFKGRTIKVNEARPREERPVRRESRY